MSITGKQNMIHPFSWINPDHYRILFFCLLILTFSVLIVLALTGKPLKTSAAPYGIVSFELAGSLQESEKIVNSWDESVRNYAAFNLGIDYLFLVLYSLTFSLGIVLAGAGFRPVFPFMLKPGMILSWLMIVAAILDAVENYALFRVLTGSDGATLPLLAKWCAVPKFMIVLTGFVYIITGTVFRSFMRSVN